MDTRFNISGFRHFFLGFVISWTRDEICQATCGYAAYRIPSVDTRIIITAGLTRAADDAGLGAEHSESSDAAGIPPMVLRDSQLLFRKQAGVLPYEEGGGGREGGRRGTCVQPYGAEREVKQQPYQGWTLHLKVVLSP